MQQAAHMQRRPTGLAASSAHVPSRSFNSTQRLLCSRRSRCAARRQLHVAAAATKLQQLGTGAWVVSPTEGYPKGIVHFLGGAFAGAAPQVIYSLFLDNIAKAGYTIIATPYAVTFRHDTCARDMRQQFLDSVAELQQQQQLQGSGAAAAPLPVFGVGHSNGSLLHLLIGSFFPLATASNVLISFNNKQVKDAIPIPGLMESLPGTMQAARAALPFELPTRLPVDLPKSSDVLKTLSSFLPPGLDIDKGGRLSNAGLALDQLASVFGEVGGGTTDFYPSPVESRAIISQQYDIPQTLVVRFADDSIDESPEVERILRAKAAQGVSFLTLPGSHVTPCGGEVPWPTGIAFTPADALAQVLRETSTADVQRLSRQVVGWLDAMVVRS